MKQKISAGNWQNIQTHTGFAFCAKNVESEVPCDRKVNLDLASVFDSFLCGNFEPGAVMEAEWQVAANMKVTSCRYL